MILRLVLCVLYLLTAAHHIVSAQYHILPPSIGRNGSIVIPVVPSIASEQVAIRVNDLNITIDSVVCPSENATTSLHTVLAIDVSGSMARGAPNMLLAKEAARSWIRGMLSGSTCAITSFDHRHYLNVDATDDTTELLQAIERLRPRGGTSYRQGLLGTPYGALRVAAATTRRRIVVFLTDGAGVLDTTEVVTFARHHNITMFCVSLGMALPQPLRTLAEQTGGLWFENVSTVSQAVAAYQTIATVAQTAMPCQIYAHTPWLCSENITGTLNIGAFVSPFTVPIPTSIRKSVVVTPPSTFLGVLAPDNKRAVQLTVSASGDSVNVVDVRADGRGTIQVPDGTLPVSVKPGEKVTLTVLYSVPDTSYTLTPVVVITEDRDCTYPPAYIISGNPDSPVSLRTLNVTSPNGGEILTAKTKVTIRYNGMPRNVPVTIDASLDDGATWQPVTQHATEGTGLWTVPDTSTTKARIRVRQFVPALSQPPVSQPMQEDISDSAFTIVQPALRLRDVRFSPQHVGTVKDSLVRGALINSGTTTANLVALRLEGTQWIDFGVRTSTPLSLRPGDSVAIELSFQPQAAGERATKLVAEFDDGQRLGVRITGRAMPPLLQASASHLDFGNVPLMTTEELFIKDAIVNTGRSPIFIRQVRRAGPDDTSFAIMSPSSFRLAPGESHTVHAAFHPVDEGRRSSAIEYVVDGLDEPLVVMLYGRGVRSTWSMRDPTTFRSIALPTAIVPDPGTVTIASLGLLGLAAAASITSNTAILVGGMLPFSNQWLGVDSLTASRQYAWSAGVKTGWVLDSMTIIGFGVQHGSSVYDRVQTTSEVESRIGFTALWGTLGLGNDDSRLNFYAGYAFKRHETAFTGIFNADATIVGLAYDRRIANSWKICSESFFMRTMPFVPITVTARYFGESYAVEGGFTFIGIPASGESTATVPIVPMVTLVKRF